MTVSVGVLYDHVQSESKRNAHGHAIRRAGPWLESVLVMDISGLFQQYSDDFERTFVDDNWARLEKYFTRDAHYVTKGQRESLREGRDEVLSALRSNVSNFDRRCDSRELVTIDGPQIEARTLVRTWRCRFTLADAPDLIVEGRERAVYRGNAIALLEEEILRDSADAMNAWLKENLGKLRGT